MDARTRHQHHGVMPVVALLRRVPFTVAKTLVIFGLGLASQLLDLVTLARPGH